MVAPPVSGPEGRRRLVRATASVTTWNLVSRLTGFARVLAMSAALGTTALGDAYQAANLVSNVLFELLAGGLLSAVLVPALIRADTERPGAAAHVANAVLGRILVALSAVVALGVVVGPSLARLLTSGVPDTAVAAAQRDLVTFLLWFFLPQIVLYAVGAVATATLHARERFTAAALAPVGNNLVVIATMVAFRAQRSGATDLDLTTGEKALLGLGTTAGVLAMTLLPVLAAGRSGTRLRPSLGPSPVSLRALVGRGAWAAGHLGLNQVMVAATIVLAARVSGGVVAYQVAFTFFLLPHAVLANPILTVLYPRLAADAAAGRPDEVARSLGLGVRYTAFLLVPAAALLAVLAGPAIHLVRFGALDAAGADLVASVLAGYAVGLVGYSGFYLLTRAAYALDDTRGPTVVNAGATVAALVGMAVASAAADGTDKVVVLGLVHAAAVTAASAVLLKRVEVRLGRPIEVAGTLLRVVGVAGVAALAAGLVAGVVGHDTRIEAAGALAAGGAVGVGAYVVGHAIARTPEMRRPFAALRGAR